MKRAKLWTRMAAFVIGTGMLIFFIAGAILHWRWAGFDKPLYDWMQLLIIPVVLALIAVWFNRIDKENECSIALDNQRESALQAYLDKMQELLLHERLRESKPGDEVRNVARVRTLTMLYQLDARRVNYMLSFLRESGLVSENTDTCIVSFKEADLNGVNLSDVDLRKVDLSEANLRSAALKRTRLVGANLCRADLSGADLSGADLREANFSGADLSYTNLSNADLGGADLKRTDLIEADLTFANLVEANLSHANLRSATLKGSHLGKAHLIGAYLVEANLSYANLSFADLTKANLSYANLNETGIGQTSLKTATLTEEQKAVIKVVF